MSSETITAKPKLRFPEFRNQAAWSCPNLGNISARITQKVGEASLEAVSITAGKGFVLQSEKFGRDISGQQYKNYIALHKGDFSYNKGNSKTFPQGCICKLKEFDEVAAPNAFISFRFQPGHVADFYQGYFENNFHGRQLVKYITSGARSDGLLNISPDDFFSIILPSPKESEQQKIVDCLTSLDELIDAEGQKLEALRDHKKGLLQNLFPAEGQTLPKFRFPEFRKDPDWQNKYLQDISEISSGTTPPRKNPEYYIEGTVPWVKTTDLNNSFIEVTEEKVSEIARVRINPKGAVLVAMYGGFKQIGRTGLLQMPAATNQAISVLKTDDRKVLPHYVLYWLNAKVDVWKCVASSSRKDPNITGSDVAKFPIGYPEISEQSRIVECFSVLDKLISNQSQKVEALCGHKKGLLQQLFPSIEEAES